MKKYLIALDLDGTTIPGLYDISEYTINVFKKLASLGHKIIITTGRPFRSSFFVYKAMNLDTPMINYNGQLIHNPSDPNFPVYDEVLNRDILLDIYNNTKDYYSHIFFESYDNIYANIDDERIYSLMHHNELSKLYTGNLNEITPTHVHGSLILAKDGYGEKILDYVNNKFEKIKARMWKWKEFNEIIELYTIESDKSNAFRMVRKYLGFNLKNTIVFGDSMNDTQIFKDAGLSICPSNACENIKNIADIVLDKSCEEDAIARFVNDYFKLGIEYEN